MIMFFEKVPIVAFIVMSMMCFVQLYEIFVWRNRVKQFEYKIPIKHRKFDNYVWMGVAVVNIVVEAYLMDKTACDYDYTKVTRSYMFMVFMWLAFLVYMFLPAIFVRKHYITNEGILAQGVKGDIYKISEVQYYIKGDIIEFYFQNSKTPELYKIFERKSEITEILAESYTKYEKPGKKEKKS